MNIARVVEAPARADPSRPAFVFGEEVLTYGDLDLAARRSASTLRVRGVGPGDRVPLVDACSLLSVATILGAARAGAAAVPLHVQLTPGELRELVLGAGRCPVAVAGDAYAARVREALGAPPLGKADLLAGEASRGEPLGDEDGEALVIFTSGTTGLPKPVPMTHRMISLRLQTFAPPFDPSTPPQVTILCVPIAHVGGALGILVQLASGNTAVVQARFDAGEWLRLAERHRVARAFLVPTMLRRILDHPDFAKADLGSLAFVAYGAAPAPPDLVARAVEALPRVAFSNVFGQTETLGAITASGPEELRAGRLGTVGRPLPGVEVRILDTGTGDEVPDGQVGELWVRAPSNARPDWFGTGDLVWRDADGYLYPAGRLSDTINRGGEKIGPAEVEAVLRAHPAVADAAVAGVPDPEMGERVGALVVAREPVSADDIGAWCRERLARYKVPERIVFVEEIPYNELGKIGRKALAEIILRAKV